MEIQVYDKYRPSKLLVPYLTLREFECKCKYDECTRTLVLESVLKSFSLLRSVFRLALIVNSGFRCQRHNKKEGGLPNSFHTIGSALDLRPVDLADLDRLEELARLFFDVVVRYETFIHCHNTSDDFREQLNED